MRYFILPQPIAIALKNECPYCRSDLRKGATVLPQIVTFFEFCENACNDQKLGLTRATLKAANNFLAALEGCVPGNVVEVSDGDWKSVADAMEHPSSPYVPAVARQIVDFIDVVLDAKTTKPEAPRTEG
jgi:hypothetical protein